MDTNSAVALHILSRLLSDRESPGGLAPVSHYLAAFADHGSLVRKLYTEVAVRGSAADADRPDETGIGGAE
ncbi:MAG: hypothetical protein AB8H80_00060 [Planctomycetota bacterium]